MKKLIALLLFSGSVIASPSQQEVQVNMMLSMMEKTGDIDRLSQCIDLSKEELKSVYRQAFADCGLDDIMSDEPSPQHTACIEKSITKHSGIDAERWNACESDDEQVDDPLLAELEAFSEQIGDREPTQAEQQKMDQIISRMQERGVAKMKPMVEGLIEGSQGSENRITLPIYPKAQLLINIPSGGTMKIAEESFVTLPGASFISTASPQQVLDYYHQQLPSYKIHKPSLTAATDVALMKTIPINFDYNRDIGKAFSIPHIYIQPANDQAKEKLAEAKTLFFIYYEPAD